MSYIPPSGSVAASWVGADTYTAPAALLAGWWGSEDKGTDVRRIAPVGADSCYVPPARTYEGWEYVAPYQYLSADWGGALAYTPPLAVINPAWMRAAGETQYIFSAAIGDALTIGELTASNNREIVISGWSSFTSGKSLVEEIFRVDGSWSGADSYIAPGPRMVYGWWAGIPYGTVFPVGIDKKSFGSVTIRNRARTVNPDGGSFLTVGNAYIWNWHSYAYPEGFSSQAHGTAYMQGGVKHVTTLGISSLSITPPVVINTTADQTASPRSILWEGAGRPDVSPRSIWPNGIYGYSTGFPLVQFPPQPKGWQSSAFGYATVRDKTHRAYAQGIDSYTTGYPDVRDRAKYVRHKASAVTSIFGDIAVRQINQKIRVEGFFSQATGDWSVVLSNKRAVPVAGFSALSFSDYTEIRNKTPSFTPLGWSSLIWGTADVGWRVRYVKPSGVAEPFNQVSLPSLWKTPDLKPSGISPAAIPTHTIWPANRRIEQKGTNTSLTGYAAVGFSYRRVIAEGRGIPGSSYGQQRVEHYLRVLSAQGAMFFNAGNAWVTRSERFISPAGIEEVPLHRHKIGGEQSVGAVGFEATRWLTRITPLSREIYPKTFGAAYGLATIQNLDRYVPVGGITTYPEQFMHWGVAKVWNLTQKVKLAIDEQQGGLAPPEWPKWTKIENRDKTIGVIGFSATRHSFHLASLNARLLKPLSINNPSLPEYQKTGTVTHKVRYFNLESINAHEPSTWAVVYNKAAPLIPPSIDACEFGLSLVANNRRYYKVQGLYFTETGYPFIAYSKRGISFESRYGISPPTIQLPTVALYSRYLEPLSFQSIGPGNPQLAIFFRRITPRWPTVNRVGQPALRNKTPELLFRGVSNDVYGQSFVRLEWRPVHQQGHSSQVFGQHRIADRKQSIIITGSNHLSIGSNLTFKRIGEDPVIDQSIDLRRFTMDPTGEWIEQEEGYGIKPPEAQVGRPDTTKGYIFQSHLGNDHLYFGTPTANANTIRVEPGYGEYLISEPMVTLRIRTIKPASLKETEILLGKPRLSPHTIYAVMEATDQALKNHGMTRDKLKPVNAGVRLGIPKLSTYINYIKPIPIYPEGQGYAWGVGKPVMVSKRRYIELKGFYVGRMGWVIIPGTQNIVIEESAYDFASGLPKVAPPPYIGPIYVKPQPIPAAAITRQAINFYHRTVEARSFLSQAMGASGYGSGLNLPQNLVVGFRKYNIPDSILATGYGEPWVSHKIRGVSAIGFDSFLSEYDYLNFKLRMKVTRVDEENSPMQTISLLGIHESIFGYSDLMHGTRYIRPDGNSDQHRKGAW